MADYSGEQLRGHTLRIEGEPGNTDGWHLNIYDETDRQRIDNITLIKLTLTPGNVIVAQQVTLRHIDQVTKRPVEEVIDVLPAQLEVSFSALVSRQSQPPRFLANKEYGLTREALAEELRMRQGMSYLVHGEWMPPKDNEKWIGYRGPDILYREEGAPNVEQLEHELDLQRLRDFCPGLNTWIAQDAIQPDQIKSVGITAETRQRPPKDNESPLWKHHEPTGFYTVSLVLADYSLKQQTFHRADLFEKKG
jgi:hypothetical protein